jgi:hypothetical protein
MTRINRAGHHRAERHRAAVIKIRYRDVSELSPGLHAVAERRGRVITVYVIPGLTAAERNAALRRLRLSGRRGYGPRLAAVPLAFARFADRIRTTVARARSVFRAHPAGATGPVMLMSAGAIAFLVLSAVSVRILREPRAPAGPSASAFGLAPAATAIEPNNRRTSRQLADNPVGSEDRVLTTAQTGPDPLLPATVPDLSGNGNGSGSGAGAGTGTGNPGTETAGGPGTGPGSGTSAGGGVTPSTGGGVTPGAGAGSTAGAGAVAGAGSTPRTPAVPSQPPVTVGGSPSGPVSVPSAPVSAPAPDPTSPSAAPTVTEPAPVSVSASAPGSVSASVAPSVSASVPVPVVTSAPVAVSVSAAAAVSASLPVPGSAAAAGSPASAQSPTVTASVTVGACLDVGPAGICLGG